MQLKFKETCPNCQYRDYIQRRDKDGKPLPCPVCNDYGYKLTDEGHELVQFLATHYPTITFQP